MSSRTSPKVAVLMGGPSDECDVSLSSGSECVRALRDEGFEVEGIVAGGDLCRRLEESAPDIVFNALHGRWGEDGCVQGILEWLSIPYTHSGVLASALAMDKQCAKEAYRVAGLPVLGSLLVDRVTIGERHPMRPPYVLKPNVGGSSLNVFVVAEDAERPPELSDDMPETVMVEEFAPGRELTTTVLGDRALTVTDILTEGWYDYRAKYAEGGSRHVLPAEVPADVFDACLEFALSAHRALGCRGLSRTDFRWDGSKGVDGLVLLETNTQPGMTPTSLTPEQARHVGIGMGELCRILVEDASCGR
ncbi:MAG: D-alanine--D-alanine ligase [Rhodobacter sp.]|nr:D-alanine--D-alanine ligase [Rhodobacter sp.]MCY4240284.1 D-alanine--D-alanine ligase [Rhodobacter sp.]